MRDILFRGKLRDADLWVEGNFYESSISGCYILQNQQRRTRDARTGRITIRDKVIPLDIDPVTVGQYIGLKDKTGRRIFEGDLVEVSSFEPPVMQIAFIEGAFCLADEAGEYVADIHYIHHAGVNQTEIIGNIHDNPGLLREIRGGQSDGAADREK